MSSPADARLPASAHLRTLAVAEIASLVPSLTQCLNRRREPLVAVSAGEGGIWFRAETWQPILLARIEEALDELIGTTWRARFTCS